MYLVRWSVSQDTKGRDQRFESSRGRGLFYEYLHKTFAYEIAMCLSCILYAITFYLSILICPSDLFSYAVTVFVTMLHESLVNVRVHIYLSEIKLHIINIIN